MEQLKHDNDTGWTMHKLIAVKRHPSRKGYLYHWRNTENGNVRQDAEAEYPDDWSKGKD